MDWKHILSANVEELSDDEKEEFYNKIAWFNSDTEQISSKKLWALFKVSQDILKYKGEQVETLLHELDELATKQGEEEARKLESDTARSSRKSSSIEFENLEQKYAELRAKYKKQLKVNERNVTEMNKLNSKLARLESENKRLNEEIQSKMRAGADSDSDISEAIKDQQKELMETVRTKNKQISDLLHDIEGVEGENSVLREKLGSVRDELTSATEAINRMSEQLRGNDAKVEEFLETINKLEARNEELLEQVQQVEDEKSSMEGQIREFSKEIENRIDEWKKLITEKDREIERLRAQTAIKGGSTSSSVSSLPVDDHERSHVNALTKVINERESQLLELQTQLQQATKDIEKNTELLKEMRVEKARCEEKMVQLEENVSEMRKQLKAAHERSQDLQDEVVFVEKIASSRETDLKAVLAKIEADGYSDLSEYVREVQHLKAQNRVHEKQIMNLVKSSNKMQDNCEQFEKENFILREKLGLDVDNYINVTGYNTKQRRYKKELDNMRKELSNVEEEKLELRSEVQKLQKIVSSLSDQILDLGQKPQPAGFVGKMVKTDDFKTFNKDLKNLSEENEALRKGLHEILNSINERKERTSTEIKSETLEKLLRALDVKHISGWYHPAMRLQAEIHNLEGVNAELREQLRLSKVKVQDRTESATAENTKEDVGIEKKEDEVDVSVGVKEDAELRNEVQKKMSEILVWEENLQRKESEMEELKEKLEITEEKLKVFTENQTDDSLSKKVEDIISSRVVLDKKVAFLKIELDKLSKGMETIKRDFRTAEIGYKKEIDELMLKNNNLNTNLKVAKNSAELSIKPDVFNELQRNFDNLTVKYRSAIENLKELNENKHIEMQLLHKTNKLLDEEKNELKTKLVEVLKKVHSENSVQSADEKIIKLSKKLSECEVNEISERQRANHTNNLYELVKEQLQKSEDRMKEFSKYNEEILHKNLLLQEQLNEMESKLGDFIDINVHRRIQNENNSLLSENEKLQTIISEREIKLRAGDEMEMVQHEWSFTKEQELLNLKHQIVDLIAASDDKMQIALLHSDLLSHRKSECEQKTRLENVSKEFENYKTQYGQIVDKYEQEKLMREEKMVALQKKIDIMGDLMSKQKTQYLGCIPLCSEEKFIKKLRALNSEKHEAFLQLNKANVLEKECSILREQCDVEINNLMKQKQILAGDKEEFRNLLNWTQEKKILQLNELRYRRQCEFKDVQMNLLTQRLQTQDEQIGKLEEELLLWHKNYNINFSLEEMKAEKKEKEISDARQSPSLIKLTKTEAIQTEEIVSHDEIDKSLPNMKIELITVRNELNHKEQRMEQLLSKITELEMNISLFKKQLGDKQSQITFYERHILELQAKREEAPREVPLSGPDGDNIAVGNVGAVETTSDETILLKDTIKSLQDNLSNKDEKIREYESLIKEDRDKHSLAAERLQEEIRNLQKSLQDEKEKHTEMEEFFKQSRPSMMTIDQYINQVHALEKHTAELHTNVTSLDAQLQSSRQEASRWREMANDRLEAMERLRENLEAQHSSELEVYKADSEKWCTEVNNLKDLISRHRSQTTGLGEDIRHILAEKEHKIQELNKLLKQQKSGLKTVQSEHSESDSSSSKQAEPDSLREILLKENETLKKRYEQLLNRERSGRDEIRDLKAQLLKKQITVARTDKTDKSIKEQLQKKVSALENEIIELKEKLHEQIAINDCHKVKISDDFDRWKKQKYWQQNVEKMKNKLKEKDMEMEKLQNTCSGYRMLIERLEREKHNLENRIKALKQTNLGSINVQENEVLKMENVKLLTEIDTLQSKLKMQQHHSGGLGAAMLQEKLEAQERKIAILEVSSKGTLEIRSELERLQTSISTLQKRNLCLEAESLDLKLDLERSSKEVPYLREQIHHLENYIEVLKSEQNKSGPSGREAGAGAAPAETLLSLEKTETKKVSELERTVFILKRVVEKLQTENKRLSNGKRPCSAAQTRSMSTSDRWKRDYQRLKGQYEDSLKKNAELEQQLGTKSTTVGNTSDTDHTLSQQSFDDNLKLKEQLEHKTQLLDKVKVLLHRAAVKEKSLLQEIAQLKNEDNRPIREERADGTNEVTSNVQE